MAVELTPALAEKLRAQGHDVPARRARKSKAGEDLAAPYPYRCVPCGTVHPTYLAAEQHLAREHGHGRLEAVSST